MTGRQRRVFTVVQIAGAGILVWLLARWPSPWNAQRYVGTILSVFGLSMIALARYQLGKSFSVRAEAHALVTHGLYSKIRNPIYVFGTVLIAGLALIFQQPFLWFVLVVVVVAQTIRARREARVLEAAFGDAYREYRRRTWF